VWGSGDGDNIVWGSDAGDDNETFPDDALEPLPSLDLEFGDLVPIVGPVDPTIPGGGL
jgi:hypothetical protein